MKNAHRLIAVPHGVTPKPNWSYFIAFASKHFDMSATGSARR